MLEAPKKYDSKHARDISLRILKILRKIALVFLLVLFALIAVLHLPPVQKKITRDLSEYLTSKIQSRVEIGRIEFSIWGNLQIKETRVWDRSNELILSAEQMDLKSNIYDLITGDLVFESVRVTGVKCTLMEGKEGLNLQYIIDAFQPKENSVSTPGEIVLYFTNITLEKIVVDYKYIINGVTLNASIGTLTIDGNEFSAGSNSISADRVFLGNTIVKILSARLENDKPSDTSETNTLFSPDFGTGLGFDIKDVVMKDNTFSFHVDQETQPSKFDPSHIDLKNINLNLSDILIRRDTLAASLQSLSASMADFKLSEARTTIHLNRNQFNVSDVFLVSDSNELKGALSGSYRLKSSKNDRSNIKITAQARLTPADLSYFVNDSVMSHFRHWENLEIGFDGFYASGTGEINTLSLRTAGSLIQARGIIQNAFDTKRISWKQIMVEASIGSDIQKSLAPWLEGVKIPSVVEINLTSTGNRENMKVNGNVVTQWGSVKTSGVASYIGDRVGIDVDIEGRKVDLGKFITLSWLGPMDCSMKAVGVFGKVPELEVDGLIEAIEILGQPVQKIDFTNRLIKSEAITTVSIRDPKYRCQIASNILFDGPLIISTDVQLDDFNMDSFLGLDSTLSVSGDLKSKIKIDDSTVQGRLGGNQVLFQHPSIKYLLDTIGFDVLMSPEGSRFNYFSDHGQGNLTANFDLRDLEAAGEDWSNGLFNSSKRPSIAAGSRIMKLDFELGNASPIRLLGIDIDFTSASILGDLDEQNQEGSLHINSGRLSGYGITLDTLRTDLVILGDSINARMTTDNLSYSSVKLGDLDLDIHSQGDTAVTNLLLSNDSTVTLLLGTRAYRNGSGILFYPDKLEAFGEKYTINDNNPVHIQNKNFELDHFRITRDDIEIDLDGTLQAFELGMKNVDLSRLNPLLSSDTVVINEGHLTGNLSYKENQQVDLLANIHGLRLYDSEPLAVLVKAVGDKNHVPFELNLSNSSNNIQVDGDYLLSNGDVEASLQVDVNDLKIFSFLVSDIFKKMDGKVKGKAMISGPIQNPALDGFLSFSDASFTTKNPTLDFTVLNDTILLDGSTVRLKNFTMYDLKKNPLFINGAITTKDYKSYKYDLKLHTDRYTLLDRSDSAASQLTGLLVVGSDIKLIGNEKDTDVEADVIIRGNTAITLNASNNEIKLLNSEGIVEFIDTLSFENPAGPDQSSYFYDSLVASLPDFRLNSTISIEDSATVRLNIDEQSGDFIEAAGAAKLEVGYDRTGNVRVSGNYTIKNGVYRLSFYDLVKKSFKLVPGSSVNWSGIPENGDLDIKAVHTVKSSSIGLIGDEVGDNEKSIYKRALPYDVGIIIKGTIENPIVSFSLDLPPDERINYPVLATKLDRMKQGEFQSELNKQVFGLLVLGGFLPESSGSDINQNVVATTALSNSVNSLLSGQLNRFASQYIKGVDIDVGIQSYSDYEASGGKTQTAMDFRVTKRILDDRLSFEVGGDFNLSQEQSGANTGNKNFRGDIAIVYDLTEHGTKKLKLFNNETYDIIYQEIRNTGVSLIFIREFDRNRKRNETDK